MTTGKNCISIMKMKCTASSFSLCVKNNLINIDVQIFSVNKWVKHEKCTIFFFLQHQKSSFFLKQKNEKQGKFLYYFKIEDTTRKYVKLGMINYARVAAEKNYIMTTIRLSYMTDMNTCRTSSPCLLEELKNFRRTAAIYLCIIAPTFSGKLSHKNMERAQQLSQLLQCAPSPATMDSLFDLVSWYLLSDFTPSNNSCNFYDWCFLILPISSL